MTSQAECPECWEELGPSPFDPGCNYGCGYVASEECHEVFCSEPCFANFCEASAMRDYERLMEEGPPGPTMEQVLEWKRLKE